MDKGIIITNGAITSTTLTAGTISTTNYALTTNPIELTVEELLDLADANFLLDPNNPPTPVDIIEFVRELGIIVKD